MGDALSIVTRTIKRILSTILITLHTTAYMLRIMCTRCGHIPGHSSHISNIRILFAHSMVLSYIRGATSMVFSYIRGATSMVLSYIRRVTSMVLSYIRGVTWMVLSYIRGVTSMVLSYIRGVTSMVLSYIRGLTSMRTSVTGEYMTIVCGTGSSI